jgi:23S rRNA (guanine745-N1)-methyltransferase
MIANVVQHLRCPVCEGAVAIVEGGVACTAGHRFDLARHGYLNLLSHRS